MTSAPISASRSRRDVREFFKDKVYRTVIPRNVRLAEAPSHGLPAVTYDARSRGAEAYFAFAKEVLERNEPRSRDGLSDANSDRKAMEKRPALGKGLSALIPDAADALTTPRASLDVDIDQLEPNHYQPRGPSTPRSSKSSRNRSRPTA